MVREPASLYPANGQAGRRLGQILLLSGEGLSNEGTAGTGYRNRPETPDGGTDRWALRYQSGDTVLEMGCDRCGLRRCLPRPANAEVGTRTGRSSRHRRNVTPWRASGRASSGMPFTPSVVRRCFASSLRASRFTSIAGNCHIREKRTPSCAPGFFMSRVRFCGSSKMAAAIFMFTVARLLRGSGISFTRPRA